MNFPKLFTPKLQLIKFLTKHKFPELHTSTHLMSKNKKTVVYKKFKIPF